MLGVEGACEICDELWVVVENSVSGEEYVDTSSFTFMS